MWCVVVCGVVLCCVVLCGVVRLGTRKTPPCVDSKRSVCAVKTPPCAPGKRPHVQHIETSFRLRHRFFLPTHNIVVYFKSMVLFVGVWCAVVVWLWWCVCVVCGEAWHTISLSLSCSLSFLFSFPFFFSLIFLFLSSFSFSLFFFFFSLLLLLLLFFLFFFFLPFYSLFSSLPFTPTNTVQSTDQQTRRPTLRRLSVMWRTVRSWQLPTNCTECCHLSSSLLFSPPSSLPPTPRKKRGNIFITRIFPAREIFCITVLYEFREINAG